MDARRFDTLVRNVLPGSSRRSALAVLTSGFLALLPHLPGGEDAEARKRKKNKKKRKSGQPLRALCTPGKTTCQKGLQCDSPTTRQTCDSTTDGVAAWCCVPPGGACSECDCCGNFYCEFDDNNEPHCMPNPES